MIPATTATARIGNAGTEAPVFGDVIPTAATAPLVLSPFVPVV